MSRIVASYLVKVVIRADDDEVPEEAPTIDEIEAAVVSGLNADGYWGVTAAAERTDE